ncbi:hypothetical protein FNF28_05706 [Cafeteria roenbergensis]|uniref:Protein kinase domain-containing protein n=1 Tax=Cafeteria roenbergensis TaxID=33653 RepID=A0A5A8D2T8_CAFRO|nr:hypothetical protein FNF28_05706 [Cafeteria roenbergensis]
MRVPELSLTFEQVFLMVWVANLVALAITLGFLLGVCRSRCISEWRQELDSDDDKQAGICPAHRDQQLVVCMLGLCCAGRRGSSCCGCCCGGCGLSAGAFKPAAEMPESRLLLAPGSGDRKWSGGGKAVRPFSGSGGDGTPPGRGEHSSGASRRRQPPIVETSILPRYQFFVWVLAFALAVRVVLLSIDFPSPPGWFRGAVYAGTPKYALLAFVSPLWYALYWIADEVAAHSLLVLPCLPVPSSSAVVRSSIVGTVFAIGGTALTWTAFIAAVVAASSPDPDALAGSLRLQRVMDVVMFSVTGTVYAVAVTGSGLGWTVRSAFSPYFVVSAVWRLAYAAALAANVYGSVIGVAVVSLKTLALPSLFIGALAADTRFWPVQGLRWELMENVRVTDLLGSGSFAAVYKCSVQTSVFAIKKFHNVDLASTQQAAVAPNEALQAAFELLVEQDSHAAMADTGRMLALRRMHNILSEVLICARLSASPYIVTCHGAASDWGEVGVLFEYCNKGTLTSAIKEQDMTVARRLRYAVQIAKAIRHVHSTEPATIHGDIKSDNILLKSTGRSSAGVEDSRALLGDFGEAVSTARLLAGDTEAKRQRGTPLWMAPEQLRAGNRVTSSSTATDIYTFGHVLGHLWNLQLPWHKEREEEQRERDGSPSSENIRVQILRFVMRQQRPALLFAENEVGAAFKKVYDACLDPDPKKRPDADSVVHQLIGVQCVLRDALLAAPEVIREQLDWDPWCSADRGNLVDFADDVEVTADEADPMAAFFA